MSVTSPTPPTTSSLPPHLSKIDTSDPRRYDRVCPFTLPKQWREESLDAYGSMLGSASLIAGGAMVTRLPQLAYIGLICECVRGEGHNEDK